MPLSLLSKQYGTRMFFPNFFRPLSHPSASPEPPSSNAIPTAHSDSATVCVQTEVVEIPREGFPARSPPRKTVRRTVHTQPASASDVSSLAGYNEVVAIA